MKRSCGDKYREDYEDIINMPHHKSKDRKHMTGRERAAQFAPFAALPGHAEAIEETARAFMEEEK